MKALLCDICLRITPMEREGKSIRTPTQDYSDTCEACQSSVESALTAIVRAKRPTDAAFAAMQPSGG